MRMILLALARLLRRLDAASRGAASVDVGHGRGCDCPPCEAERQSLGAW
jgi:hypothetical protein